MVGARLRQRRLLVGLTQQQLADRTGVGYQQMYDYEAGVDHIDAERLSRMAAALGVEVAFFFPDQDQVLSVVLPPHQRQAMELARTILAIIDPQQRQLICDLAWSLAGSELVEEIGPAGTGRIAT